MRTVTSFFGFGALALAVAGLGAGFAACGASPSAASKGKPDATTGTGSGGLTGVVIDLTGKPVAGVAVAAGSRTVQTAKDGTYTLTGVAPGPAVVVTYSLAGYAPTAERDSVGQGVTTRQDVVMVPLGASHPLDAAAGGTVTGIRGSTLTAGPGVFVDASGRAATGSVDVYLTPLDPAVSLEMAAYPGSLVGVAATGAMNLLETYGVMDVTVMQGAQKLQIASGKTVTVTIPATVAGGTPAQTDLWSFDTTTALWKHEGTTSLTGSVYTAQLPHLSYWNIDEGAGSAACLQGRVVDSSGAVVQGGSIKPTGVGYTLLDEAPFGEDFDQAMPEYTVWVKPNSLVKLTASTGQADVGLVTGSITVNSGPAIMFQPMSAMVTGCTQAPDIVIGQSAVLTDGGGVACLPPVEGGADGAPKDPFAGTCASDLTQFANCFSAGATGGCSMTFDMPAMMATTTFAGGSKLQVTTNPSGASELFYGAAGQLCASGTTSGTTGSLVLTLPPPSGKAFEFDQGGDIVCADGEVIPLDAQQSAATSGCVSGAFNCGNTGGNDAGLGGGTASVACVISQSGAPVTCIVYQDLSPAEVTTQTSNCMLETGQVVTTCPATSLVGCCAAQTVQGQTKTCYYEGTAANLMMACSAQAATWSAN